MTDVLLRITFADGGSRSKMLRSLEPSFARADIPLALLLFNCGVDAGQLAFAVVYLLFIQPLSKLRGRCPSNVRLMPSVPLLHSDLCRDA